MGIRIEWAGLYDPEMDESYFISPRTGELLSLPGAAHDDKQLSALRSKGLKATARVDQLHYVDGRFDELPQPIAPGGMFTRFFARVMNRFVRIIGRILPLSTAVAILAVLARVMPRSKRDRTQVFELVGWLEGGRVRDNCLPRALLRWYYLLRAGFDPALVFGIWVPTNNMHAWVMLDNRAAGELSDEVMHYQPALIFRRGVIDAHEEAVSSGTPAGEARP